MENLRSMSESSSEDEEQPIATLTDASDAETSLAVERHMQINSNSAFPPIINLNVGGSLFSTSLQTLTRYEDSMLAAMFSGRYSIAKDEDGRYFIDRDGRCFRYILNFLRAKQLPPEDKALSVLIDAEYFCLTALVKKLELYSSSVVSYRRREKFRKLFPGYEDLLVQIIKIAKKKKFPFEESRVTLTQADHHKLKGLIPCYNCRRELVNVDHNCSFEGFLSDIVVAPKFNSELLTIDCQVDFLVDELRHMGFSVIRKVILCGFSVRCQSCIQSGLYTAGGILAPKECANIGHVFIFNWAFF